MSSGDGKSGADARKAILARRAKFVVAALTGAGLSVAACDRQPFVCLKVAPTPAPTTPADAGTRDAGSGVGKPDAGAEPDAGTPTPCLAPPVKPKVCLEVVAPPQTQPTPKTKPTPYVCLNIENVEEVE